MNENINLDDSVLAPKRPLSMEPADTEGHLRVPSPDDSEVRPPSPDDTEGQIFHIDDAEVRPPSPDDTEGQIWH